MRAAPPLAIRVVRFGAWRGFVALMCALAAAVSVAWVLLRLEAAPPLPAAIAAAVAAGALAWPLTRRSSVALHWDGQAWLVDEHACTLDVMIDLGPWLLLRLRGGTRTRWLPVQRRGLEGAWHALRAAVYSPRPMIDAATTDA